MVVDTASLHRNSLPKLKKIFKELAFPDGSPMKFITLELLAICSKQTVPSRPATIDLVAMDGARSSVLDMIAAFDGIGLTLPQWRELKARATELDEVDDDERKKALGVIPDATAATPVVSTTTVATPVVSGDIQTMMAGMLSAFADQTKAITEAVAKSASRDAQPRVVPCPELKETHLDRSNYPQWRNLVTAWDASSPEVDAGKKAMSLMMNIRVGTVTTMITDHIVPAEWSKPDGLERILKLLDSTYAKEGFLLQFEAFVALMNVRRGQSQKLRDFLTAFEAKVALARGHSLDLPESVLNILLLAHAELPRGQHAQVLQYIEDRRRADKIETVPHGDMVSQLKAIAVASEAVVDVVGAGPGAATAKKALASDKSATAGELRATQNELKQAREALASAKAAKGASKPKDGKKGRKGDKGGKGTGKGGEGKGKPGGKGDGGVICGHCGFSVGTKRRPVSSFTLSCDRRMGGMWNRDGISRLASRCRKSRVY